MVRRFFVARWSRSRLPTPPLKELAPRDSTSYESGFSTGWTRDLSCYRRREECQPGAPSRGCGGWIRRVRMTSITCIWIVGWLEGRWASDWPPVCLVPALATVAMRRRGRMRLVRWMGLVTRMRLVARPR
jgi:hypothetical protein